MKELEGDEDEIFLRDGLLRGFQLVSTDTVFSPAQMENYHSSTDSSVRDKVEQTILEEIKQGNYVIVKDKPTVISAIGAIPKPDSDEVRLIHDCSMPEGQGLNSYVKNINHFQFQSIDDAIKLLRPGYFMAKIDLHHAYRSVPIHPHNYHGTGLKWKFKGNKVKFTYFVDTRLPFGGRRSPEIFHRLTQAVKRIMSRKGYNAIVVYLDDFLIIGESREACQAAFDALLALLQNLGFSISWRKVVPPTQRLVFLGIFLDTVECSMTLPADKLNALHSYLLEFSLHRRASKRQLQVLAGKLNWACRIVYGGRTFLRRIIDQICLLKSPRAKYKLSVEFFADLHWWISFLRIFNGKCAFLNNVPTADVQTDACNFGAGGFFQGDWYYHSFVCDKPEVANLHINFKEVLAIYFAAKHWAPSWSGQHIVIHSDNTTAVSILNKGSCKNKVVMGFLRELFWLSAIYNFRITAKHIPGLKNVIADAISRLHESYYLDRFCRLLLPWYNFNAHAIFEMPLLLHMPYYSFIFLFSRFFAPLFKRGSC